MKHHCFDCSMETEWFSLSYPTNTVLKENFNFPTNRIGSTIETVWNIWSYNMNSPDVWFNAKLSMLLFGFTTTPKQMSYIAIYKCQNTADGCWLELLDVFSTGTRVCEHFFVWKMKRKRETFDYFDYMDKSLIDNVKNYPSLHYVDVYTKSDEKYWTEIGKIMGMHSKLIWNLFFFSRIKIFIF